MANVITEESEELNSSYNISTVDGVFGFTLDSWGPSTRNSDYATALECIIQRLKDHNISPIKVYLISRTAQKAKPKINDRLIKFENNNGEINLANYTANQLRLAIGREVKNFKSDPTSQGGNSYKKILIHHPRMTLQKDWATIATGQGCVSFLEPTSDDNILSDRTHYLIKNITQKPNGRKNPTIINTSVPQYARDPAVRAWVLKQSNGYCEACKQKAPFISENGLPYLEVHHIQPLSEGGDDTPENTIAVCPNCHRKLHYSKEKLVLRASFLKIKRSEEP